jgi:hypothetical protein
MSPSVALNVAERGEQRRSGTRWSAKPQFDYYEPWSP